MFAFYPCDCVVAAYGGHLTSHNVEAKANSRKFQNLKNAFSGNCCVGVLHVMSPEQLPRLREAVADVTPPSPLETYVVGCSYREGHLARLPKISG
jgi:hypothetical protein